MKKIFLSLILGVAAFAANAGSELTVYHRTNDQLKSEIREQNVNLNDVTKITIICEDDAVLTTKDLGAEPVDPQDENSEKITFKTLLPNLEILDFGQAVFAGNTTYSSYYDNDDSPFSNYSKLKEVILPEGLETISGGAFKKCELLETVNLPSTIVTIGVNAFRDCPKVKISTLPASLVTIGQNAFASTNGNTKQAGITISEFPDGVKKIEADAFNNTNVSFSEFPDGLEEIGNKAFRSTNVSFKKFPASLKTLGTAAFVNCNGITEFTIPETLKNIPNQTFWPQDVNLVRIFYCNAMTPPTAVKEPSNNAYQGAFGGFTQDLSKTTIYVPAAAVEKYKSTEPYKSMTVVGVEEPVTLTFSAPDLWTAAWLNKNANDGFVELSGITVKNGEQNADEDSLNDLVFSVKPEFETDNRPELPSWYEANLEAEGVDAFYKEISDSEIEFDAKEESLNVVFPCSGVYSIHVESSNPLVVIEGVDDNGDLLLGYAKIYPSTKNVYKDSEGNYEYTFNINGINASGEELKYPYIDEDNTALYEEEKLGTAVIKVPGVYFASIYYKLGGDENSTEDSVESPALPVKRRADKPAEEAEPEGYTLYDEAKGIDISSISDKDTKQSLSLVLVKNNVATPIADNGDSAEQFTVYASGNIPTGVEAVEADTAVPVEYYDLNGLRVNPDNLGRGIYIMRQGAKSSKIVK